MSVVVSVVTRLACAAEHRARLDTVTPIGLAIKYAYDFAGPDKLLYSSDHPWVDPQLIIDQVESTRLPAGDLNKLYEGNARALFNL